MLCSHRPRQKRFQVTNSNQMFIQKHVLVLYSNVSKDLAS